MFYIINNRPGEYLGTIPDIQYSPTFISIEPKFYDFEKKILLSEITKEQSQFSFTRFSIFSSNLILDNLQIYTNATSNEEKYILIRYYDDADKGVFINNWYFEVDSGIFETSYLNGFTLQYSQVNIEISSVGFKIYPISWYGGKSSNSIIFQENIFFGENYNGVRPFFDISYGGPVSFISNKFENNFTSTINSFNEMFWIKLTWKLTNSGIPQEINISKNQFTYLNEVDITFKIINGPDSSFKNTTGTI